MTDEEKKAAEEEEKKKKAENETAEQKTARLEKELEVLKKQDTNAGNLRKKNEEDTKKHNKEKVSLQDQITELKTQVEDGVKSTVTEWRESVVDRFVQKDKDKVKVKEEYNILNMPETTKEEVNARSVKALKLAGFDIEGDTSAMIAPSGGSHEGDATTKTEKQKGRESELDSALFPHLQKAEEVKK